MRKAPLPATATASRHDEFYLSGIGGPVDFISTNTYRGRDANRFRYFLDKTGKRRLAERYRNYYRDTYGELRSLEPIHIVHNDGMNTITVTESYRLEDFWTVSRRTRNVEFDAYASLIGNQLDETPRIDPKRRAPLSFDGPRRVAHRIQFHSRIAGRNRDLETHDISAEGFRYRDSEHLLDDSLVFDSELVIDTDELAIANVADYNTFRKRVLRNARSGRYLQRVDIDEIDEGSNVLTVLNELEAFGR